MYAILQIGSKQYRINEGQIIRLEKLDVLTGETIVFTKVLMIVNNKDTKIGIPFIEGSSVKAEVVTHGYDKKIRIIKFRRRKHYRKRYGHRQQFTDIKIIHINI